MIIGCITVGIVSVAVAAYVVIKAPFSLFSSKPVDSATTTDDSVSSSLNSATTTDDSVLSSFGDSDLTEIPMWWLKCEFGLQGYLFKVACRFNTAFDNLQIEDIAKNIPYFDRAVLGGFRRIFATIYPELGQNRRSYFQSGGFDPDFFLDYSDFILKQGQVEDCLNILSSFNGAGAAPPLVVLAALIHLSGSLAIQCNFEFFYYYYLLEMDYVAALSDDMQNPNSMMSLQTLPSSFLKTKAYTDIALTDFYYHGYHNIQDQIDDNIDTNFLNDQQHETSLLVQYNSPHPSWYSPKTPDWVPKQNPLLNYKAACSLRESACDAHIRL